MVYKHLSKVSNSSGGSSILSEATPGVDVSIENALFLTTLKKKKKFEDLNDGK